MCSVLFSDTIPQDLHTFPNIYYKGIFIRTSDSNEIHPSTTLHTLLVILHSVLRRSKGTKTNKQESEQTKGGKFTKFRF